MTEAGPGLGLGSEPPLETARWYLPSCRQLLSYITKDKQTESLVEKLCQRFRTARYAASWRVLCAQRKRAHGGIWAGRDCGAGMGLPSIPPLLTTPSHPQN